MSESVNEFYRASITLSHCVMFVATPALGALASPFTDGFVVIDDARAMLCSSSQ